MIDGATVLLAAFDIPRALGLDGISFWIVVTCALANVAAGTLGVFLVLRRMSLIGDAIAHAVLPGIAVGFILSGTRDPLPMLAGAMAAGLFTGLITVAIHRFAKVPQDAALGVTFTGLFALGVVLVTAFAYRVDLDPHCVLHGMLETAALDQVVVLGVWAPRIAVTLAVMATVAVIFVAALWKELQATSFDPYLATTQGYHSGLVQVLLMGMVAAVTVTAFEAVGSILVVAMLVVPAATAHLLADRLWPMLLWTWGIGLACAVLGREVAAPERLDTTVAGAMTVVAGIMYGLAVLIAPRHGVLAKRLGQGRLRRRMVREDLLAILWRWREAHGAEPMPAHTALGLLGGGRLARMALRRIVRRGLARHERAGLSLTPTGDDAAESLVRRHRLWEAWLNRRLGVAPDRVHPSADRMMHLVQDDLVGELLEDLGDASLDPHGKPIPQTGNLPAAPRAGE